MASLEHSYLGDLDIELSCPADSAILIQGQGGGSCNLGTPWTSGSVDGESSNITAGEGYAYQWSETATLSLEEGCIDGEFPQGDGLDLYSDNGVPAGTYVPDEPFDDLVGCPVNGDWTITITDNIGIDNGYLFSVGLQFSSDLLDELTYDVDWDVLDWVDDPSIVSEDGGTITIDPTELGEAEYTLSVVDEVGCVFERTFTIDVEDPNALVEHGVDGIGWRQVDNKLTLTNSGETPTAAVMLYDLNGRLVAHSPLRTEAEFYLDVGGIYVAQLLDEESRTLGVIRVVME